MFTIKHVNVKHVNVYVVKVRVSSRRVSRLWRRCWTLRQVMP